MNDLFHFEAITANVHSGMGVMTGGVEEMKRRHPGVDVWMLQEIPHWRARIKLRFIFRKRNWHVIGPRWDRKRVGTFLVLKKSEWELHTKINRKITDTHVRNPERPHMYAQRNLCGAIAVHKKSGRVFRFSSAHAWYTWPTMNLFTDKGVIARGHREQIDTYSNFHKTGRRYQLDVSAGDYNEVLNRQVSYARTRFAEAKMLPAYAHTAKGSQDVRLDDFFVDDRITVQNRKRYSLDPKYKFDHPLVWMRGTFTGKSG